MEKRVKLPVSLDLKDRTLWFDGKSSMSSNRIADILLSGKSIEQLCPIEIDSAVKKFNLYADQNLEIKYDIGDLDTSFTIPEKYKTINLKDYIFKKLLEVVERDVITDENDIEIRISRVNKELYLFNEYKMEDLVRTVIYIIDTFENNSIVWGTGRGSSCACYSFYLIGLHEVDSILYELELNEFFR